MEKPTRTIKTKFKVAEKASEAKGCIAGIAGTMAMIAIGAAKQNGEEDVVFDEEEEEE